MQSTPAVSVIIPTLNEEKYLPILLESLAAIEAPLQIIVVDGNSTDTTLAIASGYQSKLRPEHSLQVIALKERGVARQRNAGANVAQNTVLLFCDADSIAPTTEQHKALIGDFVAGEYVVASTKIVPIERKLVPIVLHEIAWWVQRWYGWKNKAFLAGGYLLTRKDIFDAVGGFNESLRVSEDVDYTQRVSDRGPFAIFTIPVAVSTRRFQKYGYWWIFKHPKMLYELLWHGRITSDTKQYYPFGEY